MVKWLGSFFNSKGMMAVIGRNDPCPCGSGKKYKKCHGRQEGGAEALAEAELKRIMSAYIRNAPSSLGREELSLHIKTWMTHLGGLMESDVIEGAAFEHFLFSVHRQEWQKYLDDMLARTGREEVRMVLRSWQEPFILLAKLEGRDSGHFVLEDVFGEAVRTMKIAGDTDAPDGTVFFGTVLPDPRERDNGIQPVTMLYSIPAGAAGITGRIRRLAESEGRVPDAGFLSDQLMEVFGLLFTPWDKEEEVLAVPAEEDSIPAPAEEAEVEAAAAEARQGNAPETATLTGGQAGAVTMLLQALEEDGAAAPAATRLQEEMTRYFVEENPIVRKPGGIVAGLYLAAGNEGLLAGTPLTAKEAAKRFGVSEATAQKYAGVLASRLGK
ncbi:SEC-C metal-binding domain-containing protein [Bhargavaea cecembensis]|uniref:SEC-C metal-binding domain-containing protein n=1 Tax=Bhargavaea cecembensis TaxID=394098 RepID=UPI001C54C676|nr:SEC-C metal-binding domain-containing protein [Bhargavaea cecembensis]